ncbi:MAG: HprK-related kinase A [Methylovulum sp.]|nr:HprK-related kinase A [Methylovulum sp.]
MSVKRFVIKIEPFVVQLQTTLTPVSNSILKLYADYPLLDDKGSLFADFHIDIKPPAGLRHWYKPQVQFYFDGKTPFKPLPASQAYPFFEWGLNWCIGAHIFQYMLLHAAVVEKNGCALILCGEPGAGKSTLTAALVNRGWRLLSDEMAVIDLQTHELIPIVRPISLKNESIAIISQFAPEAVMGDSFLDTGKGTVAHMKPPTDSILKAATRTVARWVVFPKYRTDSEIALQGLAKGQTVLRLAENSFNYSALGGSGFNALCGLVEQCDCYDFVYSRLNDAVELFADISANR